MKTSRSSGGLRQKRLWLDIESKVLFDLTWKFSAFPFLLSTSFWHQELVVSSFHIFISFIWMTSNSNPRKQTIDLSLPAGSPLPHGPVDILPFLIEPAVLELQAYSYNLDGPIWDGNCYGTRATFWQLQNLWFSKWLGSKTNDGILTKATISVIWWLSITHWQQLRQRQRKSQRIDLTDDPLSLKPPCCHLVDSNHTVDSTPLYQTLTATEAETEAGQGQQAPPVRSLATSLSTSKAIIIFSPLSLTRSLGTTRAMFFFIAIIDKKSEFYQTFSSLK